jgi:hypothetical protein
MGHRTALITAGSIAVVVFAAAVAVGANLGILNAADSRPVGKLSSATVVPATTSKAVAVSARGTTHEITAAPQEYVIRRAGAVSVSATKGAIRLADVSPLRGWTWTLAQTADKKLTVTFRSGAKAYTFVAVLMKHGAIAARVDHPVTRVVSSPATSYASTGQPSTVSVAPAPAPASYSDERDGGEADD